MHCLSFYRFNNLESPCCYHFIDLFVSYFSREMQQDKPGNITALQNINKRESERRKREREREKKNRNPLNERIN